MLELLRIKNLAIIEDAELEFSNGLNVITGESGAGKSIILKSLDFLLGENLPWKMVRSGRDRAYVEAIFRNGEDEIIIRREILEESGRSRIYINDKLSSRNKVLEIRDKLIIYTSQHEQHKLLRHEYHTRLLDEYLPLGLLQKKEHLVKIISRIQEELSEIKREISEIEAKKEFLIYQLEEINRISPTPGEDKILLKRREELKNSAKLGEKIEQAIQTIDSENSSLLDQLITLASLIGDISILDKQFQEYSDPLEQSIDAIRDLEAKLKSYPIHLDKMAELEQIEARLFEIEQLKRKLNRSLDDILKLKQTLEEQVSKRDELVIEIKKLEKIRKSYLSQLSDVVYRVNNERINEAKKLEKRLKKELTELGFYKDIEIKFEFYPLKLFGCVEEKRARLLWSPNPGHSIQPIEQTVSGGELSRLFLAIITTVGDELPTLIFDEIDTGIGGLTLNKVAIKLRELSEKHQVIVVTHWPQIACMANRHFRIQKEIKGSETISRCSSLKESEIFEEISRMAGGGRQGDALASQLLKEKR